MYDKSHGAAISKLRWTKKIQPANLQSKRTGCFIPNLYTIKRYPYLSHLLPGFQHFLLNDLF